MFAYTSTQQSQLFYQITMNGSQPLETNLNGMAHVQLTVSNKYWDECRTFYYQLCHKLLKMTPLFDNESTLYCIGGRTGLCVSKSTLKPTDERQLSFQQQAIGLHHICFRLKSKQEVDNVYKFLLSDKILNRKDEISSKFTIPLYKIVHAPEKGIWASGYYSILLEDPCGIRVEFNYVPSKGWLDPAYKKKLPIDKSWSRL